jgi:hypothetical protein
MFHNNTCLNRYSINRRYLTLSLFPIYVQTLQEGGASNEVIVDVDGNGISGGVLSDWIIDELEKMCYYTADFVEDIDDVINNEDFRLICCAAEEVDDLNQDEHNQSLELTCQRIFDSSGSHDNADEAAVVQHRNLPDTYYYYYSNGNSNSTTTTVTTTTTTTTTTTPPCCQLFFWIIPQWTTSQSAF